MVDFLSNTKDGVKDLRIGLGGLELASIASTSSFKSTTIANPSARAVLGNKIALVPDQQPDSGNHKDRDAGQFLQGLGDAIPI